MAIFNANWNKWLALGQTGAQLLAHPLKPAFARLQALVQRYIADVGNTGLGGEQSALAW